MSSVLIVTLATGAYRQGAEVLFYSIRLHNKNLGVDLLCFVDKVLDSKVFDALGVKQVVLPDILSCAAIPFSGTQPHFRGTINKLNLLSQDYAAYDRVIYLDSDMLCNGCLDPLFDVDVQCCDFAAVRDYACYYYHPKNIKRCGLKSRQIVNTGLMVFSGKRSCFGLKEFLWEIEHGMQSYDGSDQGYLNSFVLRKKLTPFYLGAEYNYATDPFYPIIPFDAVVIHHFTDVKP